MFQKLAVILRRVLAGSAAPVWDDPRLIREFKVGLSVAISFDV
jgi:hypothetical protein